VPATGSKTVARTWSAPRLSGPDLYYLVGVVVGLTVFAIGVEHLLFPTTSLSEGPAAIFTAVGAFFVVVGTLCWRLPARRIELSSDGTLTFRSSRRRLEVQPGELMSVWRFPNDPWRLLPFLVAAKHGRMLLACRFDEMEGIQEAQGRSGANAQWHPVADIARPDDRRWQIHNTRRPRGCKPIRPCLTWLQKLPAWERVRPSTAPAAPRS